MNYFEKLKMQLNTGTVGGVKLIYIVFGFLSALVVFLVYKYTKKTKRLVKRRKTVSVNRANATRRSNRNPTIRQKRLNALAKARKVRMANLRAKKRK